MGIFGRRPRESSAPVAPAIIDFWEWWDTARVRVEAALAADKEAAEAAEAAGEEAAAEIAGETAGETAATGKEAEDERQVTSDPLPAELFEEIARRLQLIHPDLLWEIGQNDDGPVLTVTGGGDPELRGVTERWLRAAPPVSGRKGWRYYAARQPDHSMLSMGLKVGEDEFDLSYVRVGMRADTGRARVHVSVYHPDFLFVPEESQAQVAYHVLHWALGEDDVARWIGDVQIATEEPVDALQPAMLPAVVEQIAEPFAEPAWLNGEGRTPLGHPSQLRIRFPIHRQDYPLCDLHVEVSVPYGQANPDRLPVGSSASALRDFEKKLGGFRDRAVLAIRITGDGHRSFHLYVDPDSGVVAELDQLAAGWPEGKAKVTSEPDPGWKNLRPYQP
jgi:hypothetical protein